MSTSRVYWFSRHQDRSRWCWGPSGHAYHNDLRYIPLEHVSPHHTHVDPQLICRCVTVQEVIGSRLLQPSPLFIGHFETRLAVQPRINCVVRIEILIVVSTIPTTTCSLMRGTLWAFRGTYRTPQVHLYVYFPVPFVPVHEHDVHPWAWAGSREGASGGEGEGLKV